MSCRIRNLKSGDEAEFRSLWRGYLDFYQTSLEDEVTDHTWNRLLAGTDGIMGRGAFAGSELAGFSISILHPSTWSRSQSCYLEDLFVHPGFRRSGVGKALIEDLVGLGAQQKWSALYWHTHRENREARRLYDSFIEADEFVRYRIKLTAT